MNKSTKLGMHWFLVFLVSFICSYSIEFISSFIVKSLPNIESALCAAIVLSYTSSFVFYVFWVFLGCKRYKDSKLYCGYTLLVLIILNGLSSFGSTYSDIVRIKSMGYILSNKAHYLSIVLAIINFIIRVLIFIRKCCAENSDGRKESTLLNEPPKASGSIESKPTNNVHPQSTSVQNSSQIEPNQVVTSTSSAAKQFNKPLSAFNGVCPVCGIKYFIDRDKCYRCGSLFNYTSKAARPTTITYQERMQALSGRRDLLFNGQRPESDDYGYSKENPICTASINSTDEYLSCLKTPNGEGFDWIRKGSTFMANCNNAQNVMVDTYILYLHGVEFKTIYICPYGHNSTFAPKGLILSKEAKGEFKQKAICKEKQEDLSFSPSAIDKRTASDKQSNPSTELERIRKLYGTEADELIKYWATFYYLDEQARTIGNDSIFAQARTGLLEALKYKKGQSTVDKVIKFRASINEDKLAKELDVVNAINNDETEKFQWL